MSSFRLGHARDPDWEAAVAACLEQIGPQPPGDGLARIGFVYVADAFAPVLTAIVERLREASGIDQWVGSVGLGVLATGVEYFDQPALAVLAADLPADSFRVFDTITSTEEGFAAFERDHGRWCDEHTPYFGVVHADPRNAAVPDVVTRLSERMRGGFLCGGLSSARDRMVQVANGVTEGGVSGVMLSPRVAVSTRLSQGCSPIGPRRRVTRSEGNLLLEIDGRPALDAFYEDIGEVLARDPRQVAGYIFAALPVRGSDTGDYLVRNLVGIDPGNRVLAIGDTVEPGGSIMFCRRDADTAVADLRRMLRELEAGLDGPPRGGIYFSCLARGPNQFGPDSAELRIVEEVLGPVPLVGFFANGEISHDRLYAYTGVLTVFT